MLLVPSKVLEELNEIVAMVPTPDISIANESSNTVIELVKADRNNHFGCISV
jgi:hypothetical protein